MRHIFKVDELKYFLPVKGIAVSVLLAKFCKNQRSVFLFSCFAPHLPTGSEVSGCWVGTQEQWAELWKERQNGNLWYQPISPLCSKAHILPVSSSWNTLKRIKIEDPAPKLTVLEICLLDRIFLYASSAAKEITVESTVDHQSSVYLGKSVNNLPCLLT